MSETRSHLRVFQRQELAWARALIKDWAGITIAEEQDGRLQRCLSDRMDLLGFTDLRQYLGAVSAAGPEGDLRLLVDHVTNKETWFFRSPTQFDWLRESLLPQLMRESDNQSEPLRIWCAAVSTGQEAISLAITLDEARTLGFARPVEICASDVSSLALQEAAVGAVSDRDGEKLSRHQRAKYFERLPSGLRVRWDQLPPIRFFQHNVLRPAPVSQLDIVLARNLLIYFDAEDRKRAVDNLLRSLRRPGVFIISPSDGAVPLPEWFVMVSPGIYASADRALLAEQAT